jgi:hypothetical protein
MRAGEDSLWTQASPRMNRPTVNGSMLILGTQGYRRVCERTAGFRSCEEKPHVSREGGVALRYVPSPETRAAAGSGLIGRLKCWSQSPRHPRDRSPVWLRAVAWRHGVPTHAPVSAARCDFAETPSAAPAFGP